MYTTKILFLIMKVVLDYIKPMITVTYYQYVNSAIPTYIRMVLHTDKIIENQTNNKFTTKTITILFIRLHSSKSSLIFAPDFSQESLDSFPK